MAKEKMTIDDLAGMIQREFSSVHSKIGGLGQRFGGLEQRFDGLEQRMDRLEKGQERIADDLESFKFATKFEIKDLDKRATVLEHQS